MDPQQRVLLEVGWEAIEDAGLVPERLDAGRVGVFSGTCNGDYGSLLEDPADIDIYVAGGNALSVLSGRLCYALGLQGPSMTVATCPLPAPCGAHDPDERRDLPDRGLRKQEVRSQGR